MNIKQSTKVMVKFTATPSKINWMLTSSGVTFSAGINKIVVTAITYTEAAIYLPARKEEEEST